MNVSLKLKQSILPLALLLSGAEAFAQKNIQSTATDEKFANTTIVYKKGDANDAEILSQLNNSYGMSDVVRIAVAPPKPAVVPVAKIEKSVSVPAAVAINKPVTPAQAKTSEPVAAALPAANAVVSSPKSPGFASASTVKSQPANNWTAGTDVMAEIVAAQYQTSVVAASDFQTASNRTDASGTLPAQIAAAAPKSFHTAHSASKSTKKSKSGGWFGGSSAKKKSTPGKGGKKRGKQRYGCFKF